MYLERSLESQMLYFLLLAVLNIDYILYSEVLYLYFSFAFQALLILKIKKK
jgi:hypothetical protein